jgi:signal transduction histidine kinase
MVVPVILDDQVVAVINIQHSKASAFYREDAMLVETLALHASSTIQRLRQETINLRRGKRLEVLHRHSIELEHADTIEAVVRLTYRALSDLAIQEPSIGVVHGDRLKFYAGDKPASYDFEIPLTGRGVTLRALRKGATQIVRDTRLDPDYFNDPGGLALLSEVVVPLQVHGKPIGVLNLESSKLEAYSEEDIQFIEMLASHVSSSFQRIMERDKLQSLVEERTRELITAEQMAAAGRVSAMVAHDLRGPLQTISVAAEVIRRHPERAKETLDLIDSVVQRSRDMIEELRQNTRDDPLKLRKTSLNRLIRETLREVVPDGVAVEAAVDPGITILLDSLKVQRLLENLIRNAVEAMPGGGKLTVSAERAGESIEIRVKDTGAGIEPDALGRLFKPFNTTKEDGLGLGLVYCRRVAEMHGGSIMVESKPGEGATFIIRLPARV